MIDDFLGAGMKPKTPGHQICSQNPNWRYGFGFMSYLNSAKFFVVFGSLFTILFACHFLSCLNMPIE